MRIEVDYDKCQSNALCMAAAPTVFEVRDDGYMYVLNESPEEALFDRVRQAARDCPTQAITIIEND